MPTPTMITISGTYLKMDGSPEEGTVVFRTPVYVLHGDSSTVMVPSEISATLDVAGHFSMSVPATDDPDWTPVGWAYKISVNLGESATTYHAEVPYNSFGAAISISDMLPVAAVTGTMYATLNHEHSGYVTLADVDTVVDASLTGALSDYVRKDTATTKGDVLVASGPATFVRLGVGTNGQVLKANSAATNGVEWGTGGGSVDSVNGHTGTVVLVKSDVGLGSVDNTSDASKPVSTATQTALDGKQPLDSDLTAIAAIAPTNDDVIQRKAGAWTNRTMAQVKTDLALTKSDVGLSNVDNTSDVNKPISTATQTALNGKQALDTDLTTIAGLTATTDNVIQSVASAWASRTPAQLKTTLALVKGDVGLGNVDNTSDASKPVSTAQATAIALKPDLKAWNGSSYSAISNGVIYVGGTTDPTVNNGDIWIDTQSATDFTVTNNLTVGGNLTVSGIGARISKIRTTSSSARSTATLSDDDTLTTTLTVGTWIVKVMLIFVGSDTTADFAVQYTVPAGTVYNRISDGVPAANTATGSADKVMQHQSGLTVGTSVVYGTTTTTDFAEEQVMINVTTSGTFAVKWARSGASGSATLQLGSYFTAERVA